MTVEIYDRVLGATTAATARDGADSLALDALATDNELITTSRHQTANVQAILSAASATVTVAVVLYDASGNLLGLAAPGVQTATASAYKAAAAASDYYAPVLAFDLAGAASYEVRSGDPSSGTRTLKTWVS